MTHSMGMVMIILALLGTPGGSDALQPEPVETVVSGTLVKLDLESLRGLITTDLGKPVFFEVPKAYLFENVMVGARITVQLDEQGRAIKVMDTSLPDFMVMPTLLPTGVSSIQPLAANLDLTEPLPARGSIPSP
jgi:hypothetical protein